MSAIGGSGHRRDTAPVMSSAATWEIIIRELRSPKRPVSMSATRWRRCAPIRAGREFYSTLSSN
jgi:hypothetical protein